jgi:hypothetical protein
MVNGEWSAILLLLNYYTNSSRTISVFSFQLSINQLSIIHLSFNFTPFASAAGGAA